MRFAREPVERWPMDTWLIREYVWAIYDGYLRACLELERYEECRRFAGEGMERYPNVMLFPWWHGLARVRGGEVEAGLRDLQEIERRFVAPWYVRRDIGDVYERLGQDADAWGWYCAAARSSGDMRSRIPMLARMGRLLERLERCSLAMDHLLLAWALAAREVVHGQNSPPAAATRSGIPGAPCGGAQSIGRAAGASAGPGPAAGGMPAGLGWGPAVSIQAKQPSKMRAVKYLTSQR